MTTIPDPQPIVYSGMTQTEIFCLIAISLACFGVVFHYVWKYHKTTEEMRDKLDDLAEKLVELVQETSLDFLTGTYCRRSGERRAASWLRTAPCVAVFIDMDDFKKLNDTEGHDAGDRALVDVTSRLLFAFRREVDTLYRYGGDEFVLVVPCLPEKTEPPEDGEAPHDPLTRTLDYVAQALRDAQREVRAKFTYGIATTRAFGPADVIAQAEEECRLAKERRNALREVHEHVDGEAVTYVSE